MEGLPTWHMHSLCNNAAWLSSFDVSGGTSFVVATFLLNSVEAVLFRLLVCMQAALLLRV